MESVVSTTVQDCYNVVNFLQNPHNRHPIASREGEVWGGCWEVEV